jgi:hypothetical protein
MESLGGRLVESGNIMRIGAGVVVIMGVLVSGCGLINSSSLPPTSDPQMLMPGAAVPDQSQIFNDSLAVDESETRPPKATHDDPKPIKLLSPKWAKEDAPQKEAWEKHLDQTVNSVCQGC